ncbi:MAG: hypothetical protein RR709_10065, partial [Ruthenibacterium sp.]
GSIFHQRFLTKWLTFIVAFIGNGGTRRKPDYDNTGDPFKDAFATAYRRTAFGCHCCHGFAVFD